MWAALPLRRGLQHDYEEEQRGHCEQRNIVNGAGTLADRVLADHRRIDRKNNGGQVAFMTP